MVRACTKHVSKIEPRASFRCKQELVARSNGGVERHRTAQMRAEADWTVSGYFDSCGSTETSGEPHVCRGAGIVGREGWMRIEGW